MCKQMVKKTKRKHRMWYQKCLLLTIVLMLAGCGIVLGAEGKQKEVVYYELVEIHWGDSLWSIAKKYSSEDETTEQMIEKIWGLNGMKNENICAGDHILVPITKRIDE